MIKIYLEGGLKGTKKSSNGDNVVLETGQTTLLKRCGSLKFSDSMYESVTWMLKAFDWSSLKSLFGVFCHEVCGIDYLVTCIDGTFDYTFIRVGQNYEETDMKKEVNNLTAVLFLFGVSLEAYAIEQTEDAARAHGVNDDEIRIFIDGLAAPFERAIFKRKEARDSIRYILDFVDFVADDNVHGVDDYVRFVADLYKSFRDVHITMEPSDDDEFDVKKRYTFGQYYTRIHVYAD